MERQACQDPESGFFSEHASFTETFIDEGEAEAYVEDLVYSDDEIFVGDTLELVCNIADNAANTSTDGTPKPPLECPKCKKRYRGEI
jgi:hypothetical protein